MLEQLVQKMSQKIASSLNYDQEKQAVIQYGLFGIVQTIAIALVITTYSLITDILWECWIVYLTAGILRKSTGGAHAKTSSGCFADAPPGHIAATQGASWRNCYEK